MWPSRAPNSSTSRSRVFETVSVFDGGVKDVDE
jgi:hypothetical protein